MLEIVVGSGGMAGVSGTETTSIDIDAQRAIMKERFKAETFLSREERIARKAGDSNVIESDCGVSPGGLPGGGEGYGGGGYWACGGGGGTVSSTPPASSTPTTDPASRFEDSKFGSSKFN